MAIQACKMALSLGLPAVSRKKKFPASHMINRLFTGRFFSVPGGRLLASCFFCVFLDRNGVDIHKHAKKATQNLERGLNPEGTNKLITNLPQLIDSRFFTRRFAEYNLDTRSVNSPWLKPNANEGFF